MKLLGPLGAMLSLATAAVSAVTISGKIAPNQFLPIRDIPANSKVSLGHEHKVWIRRDGSFEFSDVQEGAHILEPVIPGWVVQPLLVTVTPDASAPSTDSEQSPASPETPEIPSSPTTPTYSIHVQPYHPAREALPPSSASMPHPILLTPTGREDFFTPPGGMNMGALFKNPMVLMMLASAVMMYGLPKLTASISEMDPEMAKEMAQTQKKMRDMQNADWSGSLSSMLAGTTESDAPVPSAAAPALAPAVGGANSGSSTPRGGARGGKARRGR
ncbi:hypothetical protein IAU60_001004 [Kwoniella sp. DSM 27419]